MPVWGLVLAAAAAAVIVARIVYRVVESRRLRDHFADGYELPGERISVVVPDLEAAERGQRRVS